MINIGNMIQRFIETITLNYKINDFTTYNILIIYSFTFLFAPKVITIVIQYDYNIKR